MGNITAEALKFASSRETSDEIAQAILDLAADYADAERLWSEATRAEEREIAERAWVLADADKDVLHWGCGRIRRNHLAA